MKTNQIKAGMIISYSQIIFGILIGLLYTPVMIKLLGESEYGLYNTVSSTISMLSILSLGFNSGYIRFFSKYKKQNDEKAISKLNGMFLVIFLIIGIVAFLCGIFLSNNLRLVFDEGLSAQEYKTAKILMILLTINLSVSFPMSVFSNIISANEKFVFLKLLGLLKTVISPLVTLPLLLAGYRSIGVVLVTLLIAIITDVLYLYYVLFVLKNKFIFHSFEKNVFKELFVYTSFIAINIIVDQINWNIDKLLLARYKGTFSVAVYSVGYTLFSYYMTFSTSISGIFTPRVHRIINQKNSPSIIKEEITNLFIKVGRVQFLMLGLVACGLVFFGHSFITLYWAGEEYSDSYYVLLLLVIPSSIALIQNVGIEVQRAMNKHKFRSIVYSIMACVNLVLSIFLCKLYGAIGSAIGTAISLVICNGIVMNIYYAKECNINIILFWKKILKMSRGMIIPVLFGIFLWNFGNDSSWLLMGIRILSFVAVYIVSMWIFGIEKNEKNFFTDRLNKILKK